MIEGCGAIVLSLDGKWELRELGCDEPIDAVAPGCVHTDLMAAGRIDDPFYADNEYRVAWVHETDWQYARSFEVTGDLLGTDRIFLECDGLDTLAEVTLNDEVIGRTDNMYLAHSFDVTSKLIVGSNRISIDFPSAANYAKAQNEKNPLVYPHHSLPGAPHTRKSPSQYGWDWGPKIPTSGIWRPIRLVGYRTARIEDLWIRQSHNADGTATLEVEVAVERFCEANLTVAVELIDPKGDLKTCNAEVTGSSAKCSITLDDPMLWWPNGYGSQPLYTACAKLVCEGELLHTASRKIGLRSVHIKLEEDAFGESFTFVINGVEIFCKGANWVPADQFPSRISDERYQFLIRSSVEANMNMLRIWGGGFYEDELFYDLCDEYGILVWQDFMFSCSQYPVGDAYLANVAKEVEHNIKRLRNRACVALWCGNNEIEAGIVDGWSEGADKAQMEREYAVIFHELIPEIISRYDPDRFYWPSSPSNGIELAFRSDANDENRGDGHYWDVWHGKKPFAEYRTQFHRFMSEFGFESLPAIETVRAFAEESDLNITSYVMECHQKNAAGNGLILHYLAQTFRFPKDFEMMCCVSQLLQAEAMRFGVEHWRRNRPRSMGTLYWQLNDCWPVCSWSSIDYFGRWKALQYFARRFFAPIHLSVSEENAGAEIHVTNDTLSSVDVEIEWTLESLDGEVVRKGAVRSQIEAERDHTAAALDFADVLIDDASRNLALITEMKVEGKPIETAMTAFVPSKHLNLSNPGIAVSVKRDEDGCYLEVSAQKAARFVQISIPGKDVILSDNYFDLPAGRKVKVRPLEEIPEKDLSNVRIYSLYDSF